MTLETRLAEKKAELVEKWCDLVLDTYPEETRKIWKAKKDRFSNPVGTTIFKSLDQLFDLILAWDDAEQVMETLEPLIKIRCVQDFAPSQALSFIFMFKKLIREDYQEVLAGPEGLGELLKFEVKVDNLALISFDIFCKNREQIFQMRVDEVKRAQHNILRRANMFRDVTADKAEE